MRTTPKSKAVCLLSILIFHLALGSPVVKRDVLGVAGSAKSSLGVAASPEQVSLLEADVFGGQTHEGSGSREKRLLKTALKLKGLAIGAGLKAVGTGVKTVGALGLKAGAVGAKAVGKTALKAATKVGVKVAKAAITIGIAKLLLNLVFGKINQLIDFKTRLLSGVGSGKGILSISNLSGLSNSSGSSSSSSGGGSGSSGGNTDIGVGAGGQSYGDETTASVDIGGAYGGNIGVAGDVEASAGVGLGVGGDQIAEKLPVLDPEKISLDVPGDVFAKGFNIVNKGAPLFGDVIQRTAGRLVNVAASLKPILGSSLGFQVGSRGTRSSSSSTSTSSNAANDLDDELADFSFNSEKASAVETRSAGATGKEPSQFRRRHDTATGGDKASNISTSGRKVKTVESQNEETVAPSSQNRRRRVTVTDQFAGKPTNVPFSDRKVSSEESRSAVTAVVPSPNQFGRRRVTAATSDSSLKPRNAGEVTSSQFRRRNSLADVTSTSRKISTAESRNEAAVLAPQSQFRRRPVTSSVSNEPETSATSLTSRQVISTANYQPAVYYTTDYGNGHYSYFYQPVPYSDLHYSASQ